MQFLTISDHNIIVNSSENFHQDYGGHISDYTEERIF